MKAIELLDRECNIKIIVFASNNVCDFIKSHMHDNGEHMIVSKVSD